MKQFAQHGAMAGDKILEGAKQGFLDVLVRHQKDSLSLRWHSGVASGIGFYDLNSIGLLKGKISAAWEPPEVTDYSSSDG